MAEVDKQQNGSKTAAERLQNGSNAVLLKCETRLPTLHCSPPCLCCCAVCMCLLSLVQCVRMAVLLGEPYGEVFEVKHTGFVVLQQHVTTAAAAAGGRSGPISPAGSRKKEPWKLVSEPGETGVLWLEEDVSD